MLLTLAKPTPKFWDKIYSQHVIWYSKE